MNKKTGLFRDAGGRDFFWTFALVTSLFFLWGFAHSILDVLNKHFQVTLHVSKAFEDKFGCNVEHVYFNSYDELMTTLQTGGTDTIDCVVLSQNYTQYFVSELYACQLAT